MGYLKRFLRSVRNALTMSVGDMAGHAARFFRSVPDYFKPRRNSVYLFLVVFLPLLLYLFDQRGSSCSFRGSYADATPCYAPEKFSFSLVLFIAGSVMVAYLVAAPMTRFVSLRWGDSRLARAVPGSLLRILSRPTSLRLLFLAYIVGAFAAFAFIHIGMNQGNFPSLFAGGYFLFALPAGFAHLIVVSTGRLLELTFYQTEAYRTALIAVSIPVGVAWLFFVAFCLERVTKSVVSSVRRLGQATEG